MSPRPGGAPRWWSERPDVQAVVLCRLCIGWEPARLHELVVTAGPGGIGEALAAVGRGERHRFGLADVPDPDWSASCRAANGVDAHAVARGLDATGVRVTWVGAPEYPAAAVDDAEPPPAVLTWRGDLALISATPRVAIVGTRTPTVAGAQFAFALGRDLARAGVTVVSGLARGIDGAAHRGALAAGAAPLLGVVGSGLDIVYPAEHRDLWEAVCTRGLLLSETPVGTRPDKRRFTHRNRLLAALGAVVVVVESAASGGSLSTAWHATERGRPLLAVPGGPWSPVSAGTNDLIRSGRPRCVAARPTCSHCCPAGPAGHEP